MITNAQNLCILTVVIPNLWTKHGNKILYQQKNKVAALRPSYVIYGPKECFKQKHLVQTIS